MMKQDKPLGGKAYGSIPHVKGSKLGEGEYTISIGQQNIATQKVRDKYDHVIVQEKLDGSCVAVAKIKNKLVSLGRAGYPAISSKFIQHKLFHDWAVENYDRFDRLLSDGERAVGEWLAQAHGTIYNLSNREPFVLFDIMTGTQRITFEELQKRAGGFVLPPLIGVGPTSIELALEELGNQGFYGAEDLAEGIIWRVERQGKIDFLCKYVRKEKEPGKYLPEISGGETIWNWNPNS